VARMVAWMSGGSGMKFRVNFERLGKSEEKGM
jgi:hypothetical protein